MILYKQLRDWESGTWPALELLLRDPVAFMETYDTALPGAQIPELGVVGRALIGSLLNDATRPWGAVTALGERLGLSRQTLYTIAARVREGCLIRPNGRPRAVRGAELAAQERADTVTVTENRLKRLVLSNLLPGGMAIRPQQASLQAALDTSRSVGWISELILEAGARAGAQLARLDLAPLGAVVTVRDELYFGGFAWLLHVEPQHLVLISGAVERGCDAETWSVALQLDHHTRGLELVGLAEDAAPMYPASLRQAGLAVAVQKDIWHIARKAQQTVARLEQRAWQALTQAERLWTRLLQDAAEENAWRVAEWATADARAEALINVSHELRELYGHLCDALELVDWRSGEIRDRAINSWLLAEVLQALRQLPHAYVGKLVTYLHKQQPHLLTFFDRLTPQLSAWQQQLARHLPTRAEQQFFQATVARAWRLQRAVANGQRAWQAQAQEAHALLALWLAETPPLQPLADALYALLESVIRTSSAAETINSLLRPYLTMKRSFQSRATAQAWLNLFCLWFNMHPLQRSKRRHAAQPMSPYQYAGINVYTAAGHETLDWLEALGYPPDT